MNITCNNKPRTLHTYLDLPEAERADFDYIEEDDRHATRLFKYRGSWYDYYEFEVASDTFKAEGFDGMQAQSYFDAIIVRYFDKDGYEYDGEIVVGHAHW